MQTFRSLASFYARQHAPQQIVVVLVAIGLEIEIFRYFGQTLVGQTLVADSFDMLLHEAVVVAPLDAGGAHSRLLGASRDLMRMKIVQPELIDQRLLDLFMQD